ncbi:hypothetical protein OROMI_007782 [Orobanche minor]
MASNVETRGKAVFIDDGFPVASNPSKADLCRNQLGAMKKWTSTQEVAAKPKCSSKIFFFRLKQQIEACRCGENLTNDEYSFPSKDNHHLPSISSSSFRIAIVGDIHEDWKQEHDSKPLHFLLPDMVMFTGDFGNENTELVKCIANLDFHKAAILGNHDSWSTSKFSKNTEDGVRVQLECLGEEHVGYGHMEFPALNLSVVGGEDLSLVEAMNYSGKSF